MVANERSVEALVDQLSCPVLLSNWSLAPYPAIQEIRCSPIATSIIPAAAGIAIPMRQADKEDVPWVKFKQYTFRPGN